MKREFHLFIVLLLSIVISFYSCTKEPQFVAGEVLFQAYASTSFFSASKLFDSLQLKIKVAYNYEYLIRTTAETLNLKENLKGNLFKWGILLVPGGQEQHWVDELKNYSIIKAVQLNHVWY